MKLTEHVVFNRTGNEIPVDSRAVCEVIALDINQTWLHHESGHLVVQVLDTVFV